MLRVLAATLLWQGGPGRSATLGDPCTPHSTILSPSRTHSDHNFRIIAVFLVCLCGAGFSLVTWTTRQHLSASPSFALSRIRARSHSLFLTLTETLAHSHAQSQAPVLACPSSLHGAVSVRWASKSIKKTRAEESSSGTEDEEKLALKMDAIEVLCLLPSQVVTPVAVRIRNEWKECIHAHAWSVHLHQ